MYYRDELSAGEDFCHFGFVVPNMEKSLHQWRDQDVQMVIEPTIDPIQNVICTFFIFQNCLPIELVAPTGIGNSPLDSRLRKGGGLDHVCRFVDDVKLAADESAAKGSIVLVKPTIGCVWNREIAFVYLKSGLILEFMSRSIADTNLPDPLQLN